MKLSDVIIEAEYADILITLLNKPYSISSITKLIFISFCIKHEKNTKAYNNRTKDFVDVFFKNISIKLPANYQEIEKIINIIDMLKITDKIKTDGDYIYLITDLEHTTENEFLKYCNQKKINPILEINKLDAKAMIEEVIRYV